MYELMISISDSSGKDYPLLNVVSKTKYKTANDAIERALLVSEVLPNGSVIRTVKKRNKQVVSKIVS